MDDSRQLLMLMHLRGWSFLSFTTSRPLAYEPAISFSTRRCWVGRLRGFVTLPEDRFLRLCVVFPTGFDVGGLGIYFLFGFSERFARILELLLCFEVLLLIMYETLPLVPRVRKWASRRLVVLGQVW